ncbi:ABC transporter permease [Sanguibacter sp. 25GB23B1]|uniref:ABC transporter permease n=1 Tax=unclassified Sanguibacter TaxID=2645534 RepID=UPI0032AEAF53
MTGRTLPTALRWAARWRAAVRIARRDATRHRGRTALVAALVALPLVAGSAGLVLLRSTEPSDASIVRDSLGPHIQARLTMECDGFPYKPSSVGESWCEWVDEPVSWTADEMDTAFTAALPPGSTVLPVRTALVDYIDGRRSQVSKSYTEVDLTDDTFSSLAALESGRAPRDASEILVSGHMARSAVLDVGDTVDLRPALHGAVPTTPPVTFTVVGIGRVGAGVPVDFVALPGSPLVLPFDDANPSTWYVTGDAPVLREHAELLYPLGVEVLSRDVIVTPEASLAHSGSMVSVAYMLPYRVGSTTLVADVAVLVIIGALVLLEAVLLIGPAFVVGARRETRNLALIAATGGEPADLRRIVLATGLVVGGGGALAGTVLGAALGVALVPALRTQDIYVPDVAIPVAELCALALAGTAIALAAAWWPARQAARTDVVAALSGRRPVIPGRRRMPVTGLACLAIGVVAVFVGALAGWTVVLLLGILALQVGVIGTAGSLVGRLARAAHRTSPSLRYALRDADRHRARTAPALAAIIAVTTVAAAGLTFQASQDASEQRFQLPDAAVGTLIVDIAPPVPGTGAATSTRPWLESVEAYRQALVGPLGGVPIIEVRAPVPPPGSPAERIEVLRPPENACRAEQQGSDPRCGGQLWTDNPFSSDAEMGPVLVDDGGMARALALPGADETAEALASEHVVVASERDLRTDADGSTVAHLAVPGEDEPVVVPAVAHQWGEWRYRLILPPGVVEQIGWTSTPVGFVVPATARLTGTPGDPSWALPEVPGIQAWSTETTPSYSASSGPLVAAIAGAALLSVLATWIVVGLAAAESRPDLATISAVGASPRTRRALAGAQAGVLAVVGTGLGIGAGVFFGGVLVLAERVKSDGMGWTWQLELPWLFLALLASTGPLLAIGGAALATRSHLPLTRRLAS